MTPKIECPACGHWHSRVVDVRPHALGVLRARRCEACGHRYPTVERRIRQARPPRSKLNHNI